MSALSTLKTTGRAAVIALALGAASLGATPASAQSFNFNLGVDSGGQPSFGFGVQSGERGFHRPGRGGGRWERYCLTNREIVRGLGSYGYRDADITRNLGRDRVEVVARYGRDWYQMRVDRCTGVVDRVERLRRPGGRPGGGFGLQFNF
ncbi:hypothetical protein EMQ25_07160 [Arsenicitalea aurantiaca]|uniref:PepSY domain-containing protein n=1 Tax=Arsenicitalea aurantiaca TaxID=1783274 RepID=A0A433XFP5_9HYPH|nr:hypothetical protein [Arsenicitalea aurantiaca]RUT32905.1 hypothetical protein EMQ25_07160 [Arsenicitalea aurantiaca]